MKRLSDIILSLLALLLLSPILGLVGLLIALKLGSPVFYVQERIGLLGRPFRMIKFRTMTDDRNDTGELLPDAERLTKFGAFLRSSSLDEFPELWNVISGDMSLVGPRPLLMEYLPLYSPEQAQRHEARPGITGLAQVNGRNAISWEEKLLLDVWYVKNQSLWLDIKILFQTAKIVLLRKGITPDGKSTMPKFTGEK